MVYFDDGLGAEALDREDHGVRIVLNQADDLVFVELGFFREGENLQIESLINLELCLWWVDNER